MLMSNDIIVIPIMINKRLSHKIIRPEKNGSAQCDPHYPWPEASKNSVKIQLITYPNNKKNIGWMMYPFKPCSLYIPRKTVPAVCLRPSNLSANIIRVLATSKGVVTAAAKPPAIAPQTATAPDVSGVPVTADQFDFKYSQMGNWNSVKGISRSSVLPKPR